MSAIAAPSPLSTSSSVASGILPPRAEAMSQPCMVCEGSAMSSMGCLELSLPVVCSRHRDEMGRSAPGGWARSLLASAWLAVALALLLAFGSR